MKTNCIIQLKKIYLVDSVLYISIFWTTGARVLAVSGVIVLYYIHSQYYL